VLRVPAAALRFKPDAALLARATAGAPEAKTPGGSLMVWVSDASGLRPVPVVTGVTDGSQTEIVQAPLQTGVLVVTRASSAASTTATRASSPLLPSTGGGRPPR
jgi:hypothetical protein